MTALQRIAAKAVVAISLSVACVFLPVRFVSAGESDASGSSDLAGQIDRYTGQLFPSDDSALCSDAQFLRRVFLDLTGTLPSVNETREFIDDPTPNKREQLIDRLLDRPRFARHMANVFDVMWMERRANKHVKQDQWLAFLRTSFEQETPLNEIIQQILAADGVQPDQRGPAKFYLEREVEPNLLTREVGRMFFGMDVQCAQCHDHPVINDYLQRDYYGLFAFLNRSYLFQPDTKKPAVLAEKAEGDTSFKSVFTDEEGETGPKLPGDKEIEEPELAADQAYQVKPDPKKKNVRPIPTFSRREVLAKTATDGSNDVFNRNLANRLWAHMIGRGLVHPVDQHHSENPPVHPELLDRLADALVQVKFDIKPILRQIALSKTYQRPLRLPGDLGQSHSQISEQLTYWQEQKQLLSKAFDEAENQLVETDRLLTQVRDERNERETSLTAATEQVEAATKQEASTQKALVEATQSLNTRRKVSELLNGSIEKLEQASKLSTDLSELDGVLPQLQTVRDQTRAKLEQSVDRHAMAQAAADQATKALTTARAAATKAQQAVDENQRRLATLDLQYSERSQAIKVRRTRMQHAIAQASRLQKLAGVAELASRRDSEQDDLRETTKKLADATETARRLGTDIATLQQAIAKLEGESEQTEQQILRVQDRLQKSQEAAQLITDSRTAATKAATLLARQDAFASVTSTLASHQQDLSSQTAALQTQLDTNRRRMTEIAKQFGPMRQRLASLQRKSQTGKGVIRTANEQRERLTKSLASLKADLEKQQDEVADILAKQFSVAVLQPLSPEQLANSMLDATGYREILRKKAIAAVDKKSPLKQADRDDPAKVSAYENAVDEQLRKSEDAVIDRFVKLFAAAGGQPQDDFFATVDQALYFRNGSELRSWLNPTSDNLVARLETMEADDRLAEELYLSVLTRRPTSDEQADIAELLSTEDLPRLQAIQEAVWALLTSTEFRFHH